MSWYPMTGGATLPAHGSIMKLSPDKTLFPPPPVSDEDLASMMAAGSEPSGDKGLDAWAWKSYSMHAEVAAKMGFAVADLHADRRSRVLVAEWGRSKIVEQPAGKAGYGVAARLVVKTTDFSLRANLSLPLVAAEAESSRAEASASLTVEGYVGPGLTDLVPEFPSFDVESYVRLKDALSEIAKRIDGDHPHIRPRQLWAWVEEEDSPAATDDRMTRSVGTFFALTEIERGRSLTQATGAYADRDDDVARTAIEETYLLLSASGGGNDEIPDERVRARARDLLDGYHAKLKGWFRKD